MLSRFKIYVNYDYKMKKYSGYSLLLVEYENTLDFEMDYESASEWIYRGVDLPTIMIYCDLNSDIELINRKVWEENIKNDEY